MSYHQDLGAVFPTLFGGKVTTPDVLPAATRLMMPAQVVSRAPSSAPAPGRGRTVILVGAALAAAGAVYLITRKRKGT